MTRRYNLFDFPPAGITPEVALGALEVTTLAEDKASPNPHLRSVARYVTQCQPMQDLADRMLAAMRAGRGIGLAAPQIGQNVAMFVMGMSAKESNFLTPYRAYMPDTVCINPEIEWSSRETVSYFEECMSLVDMQGSRLKVKVSRPKAIRIGYFDLQGARHSTLLTDWHARVCNHEIDHLSGVLISDYSVIAVPQAQEMSHQEFLDYMVKNSRTPPDGTIISIVERDSDSM